MNINSDKVKELLKTLDYFCSAMNNTVKMGDDGWQDAVNDLYEEHLAAIKTFEVMNFQELTPVNKYEGYKDITTLTDAQAYAIQLKSFIKKALSESIYDYSILKNEELLNALEADTILGSKFEKHFYSKEYFYTSQRVMQEIVDEMIKARVKAPQQSLFK